MSLGSYLTDLSAALDRGDREDAVELLHEMTQRDPLDQRDLILDALRRIQVRWPELRSSEPPPRANTETIEQTELSLGTALQHLQRHPSEETLQRIRVLGQRLVAAGELTPIGYIERSPTPPLHHSRSSSGSRSPTFSHSGTLGVLILALALLSLFGVGLCSSHDAPPSNATSNTPH